MKFYFAREQPNVLSAFFKQIEKAKWHLAKWNVSVSDDDIILYVVDQMYESDWFSEVMVTKWDETRITPKYEKIAS